VTGGRWYTGAAVKKTSIYIEDGVDRALARRAAAEGTTKAAVIREALAQAGAAGAVARPRVAGVFDGPGDLSQDVDEYLDRTGFGES
jgi:Ribbon-helix-helix protein, copG family